MADETAPVSQDVSYRAVPRRKRTYERPWVCRELGCDEALPRTEPKQPCPHCGAPMITGGAFLAIERRDA